MIRGVDYIGVGIGAVILNPEGKILLSKRGPKARNERGKWEFPGGGVEFGDTMEMTVKREMQEELGIEIELHDHLPVIDHILPDEGQHWVTSGYIATISKGIPTIKEPEKCSEIGWFSLKELKEMKDKLSIAAQHYLPFLDQQKLI
jgi:mutator protein MutT